MLCTGASDCVTDTTAAADKETLGVPGPAGTSKSLTPDVPGDAGITSSTLTQTSAGSVAVDDLPKADDEAAKEIKGAAEAFAEEEKNVEKARTIMRVEYISQLTCPSQSVEIGLIVEQAGKKNKEMGVGGFLTYNETDHVIKQLFEGDEETIKKLWTNIQADARHKIDEASVKISYPDEMLSEEWAYGMTMVPADTFKSILAQQMKGKGIVSF